MQTALILISALSFSFFGVACFLSPAMHREFFRYGLAVFRPLVGTLQILGAAGLLVGFLIPGLGRLAAGGLALLMFLGVVTRIRIRDTFLQTTPAAFYCLLNAWICLVGYQAS